MADTERPTEEQQILARLDLDHIDRVAQAVAEQWNPAAIAVLHPGDRTQYEITFTRVAPATIVRDPVADPDRGQLSSTGDQWVNVSVTSDGGTYRWDLENPPAPGYVQAHWDTDEYHTIILTHLLQRVSHHWAAQ